jgi:hypothetical protein
MSGAEGQAVKVAERPGSGAYTTPLGDTYHPLPGDAAGGPGGWEAPVETHQQVMSVKEGETFVCSDLQGDLSVPNTVGMGVYYRDTRFLSRFEFRISGADPVLLSSSAERAHLSYVDLTNPDLWEGEVLAGNVLHPARGRVGREARLPRSRRVPP